MASTSGLPVRTLNLHQGYRCRHSGVCCTSAWDIPIDHRRFSRVSDALARGLVLMPGGGPAGQAAFVRAADLPDGAAAVVSLTPAGACVFFDREAGRLCALHSGLGHESLPAACRHFPRVVLLDDSGIDVAWSHVCPTAADMLFRDDVDHLAVVTDPTILADRHEVEGFDARGTIPPFVHPGTVFDPDSRHAWESFVLTACSRGDQTPAQVLMTLAGGADRLRAWRPACGGMGRYAQAVLSEALSASGAAVRFNPERVRALHALVDGTVPGGGVARPPLPDGTLDDSGFWGEWPDAWRAVNRYLGARAFGAWSTYRGYGVRTQVAVLGAALAVLSVEAGRRMSPNRAPFERAVLRDAIGAADLLTVHQSDDGSVCHALAGVESLPPGAFAASLGLEPA